MSDGIIYCPTCEYYEGVLSSMGNDEYKCSGCDQTWFITKVKK